MVVAPLLGPIMALALGMVLGDARLARQAVITNGAGLVIAFASAAALGVALRADPSTRGEACGRATGGRRRRLAGRPGWA